jgi:hypothetical protein
MAQPHRKSPRRKPSERATTRRFRARGVEVEIREAKDRVELRLDEKPVDVELIDGELHSQLAHMFMAFESVDELVETLLANEGRTWTLHGHICDERCGPAGHHHDHGPGHSHGPGHGHGHGGGGR